MTTIKIAAVGDLLMWRRQIESAKRPGNTYSFDSMFREVAPHLRSADLTIGNLETTLSGREDTYQRRNPKTGWPMFNCPDELAGALKRAGVDVLTTANNHCLDRGFKGLRRTLHVLDKQGIQHTGTYGTKADATRLLIRAVRGMRVGILSYTYGTNGFTLPAGLGFAVNRINLQKMRSDLKRMRSQADVVVVAVHFGQEFHRHPNERQKTVVNALFRNGADIVLGAHPHVLQPMVKTTVRAAGGRSADKFVIYSMGNFISDRMMGGIHSDSGVIVNVTVEKDTQGAIHLRRVQAVPTWVHRYATKSGTRFRVLPVRRSLTARDKTLSEADRATMRRVYRLTTGHLLGRGQRK